MIEKLVVAGLAIAVVLGVGSLSAQASPAGSALAASKPGSFLLLKADWDDRRHGWWWRHHHRDWDDDDWRGRWWRWHHRRDRDWDDWRGRHRHHHRDWDDRY